MSHKTSSVASGLHPPVGTLIDGNSLELVEVLGVGGYGVVYRAVDTCSPSPKSYAVKCLVAQPHQLNRQRQIHIREIALHQLAGSHPNVVTLHRVIEEYNRTYIILDYAPDHDLFTQILHNCRYLGDDVLIKHVFLQLLDAVEYCHSLGIYHRDLKPENVLCFDDGYRVAITDFGLATTDKLSEEFRTGSVYHMSPECQGGEFAPTGNYSPLFNDIWSLGIILLNLATGRNPWKSATLDDPTFRAYLRDPLGFLPTVLPISSELNDLLVRMLEVDWRERINLRELRQAVEDVHSFYSDDVVFEGSMARCPWESGMDIDSDEESSESSTKAVSPPPQSEGLVFHSHWSKDSYTNSDIVFARNSVGSFEQESSFGITWTNFSSTKATWAFESPTSSVSPLDYSSASTSAASFADPTPPVTPDNSILPCSDSAVPRKGLTLDTNLLYPSRYYNPNASLPASLSGRTSMMQTAVEFEPYSCSFFTSTASESKASLVTPMSINPSMHDNDMKEVHFPSWVSPTTEISSPSIYSSSSFAGDGEMSFSRSQTPSPNVTWSEDPQVRTPLHNQSSQPSSSFNAMMTDVVSPPSRHPISLFACRKSNGASAKFKTAGLFGPIKLFPRPSPSPSPSPPPAASAFQPGGSSPPKSPSPSPGNQTHYSPCFSPAWCTLSKESQPSPSPQRDMYDDDDDDRHCPSGCCCCSPIEVSLQRPFPEDQRVLRSPKHWFMPGKFFAYAGAQ